MRKEGSPVESVALGFWPRKKMDVPIPQILTTRTEEAETRRVATLVASTVYAVSEQTYAQFSTIEWKTRLRGWVTIPEDELYLFLDYQIRKKFKQICAMAINQGIDSITVNTYQNLPLDMPWYVDTIFDGGEAKGQGTAYHDRHSGIWRVTQIPHESKNIEHITLRGNK